MSTALERLLRNSRWTPRIVRKVCCALTTQDSLTVSGRQPEDLVLLDLSKAVFRRQTTVDREPLVRVPEVRQVESTEAGERHSRVTNDEIIFYLAAPSAVSNIDVEGLAAPFGYTAIG